jgi:hypothetical protein
MESLTVEITGYDTILVSFRVRPDHIRDFVERLVGEWPDLLASNSAAKDAGYQPWRSGAVTLGDPEGELYLVRDEQMRAQQQEEGYAEAPDGASPVAVYYNRAPASLDIRILEEWMTEDGKERDSYPARLVGREIFLVTLVTAADPTEDGFAKRVLEMLTESLTAP